MANLNDEDLMRGIIWDKLSIILLIDVSRSMMEERIAQVNQAMPILLRELKQLKADEHALIQLRALTFSDQTSWWIGNTEQSIALENVRWHGLVCDSHKGTRIDLAVLQAELALRFDQRKDNSASFFPLVILITDGKSRPGSHSDYLNAVALLKSRLARFRRRVSKTSRFAVGVGDYEEGLLREFAASEHGELVFPLKAVECIRGLIDIRPDDSLDDFPNDIQDDSIAVFPVGEYPGSLL